ncbi:hypothetical protein BDZ89DRAFT_1091225 [Hymenopellis radicata]|nr:hypothetical protein BDZ89DRAFT_1091225 [Hymenopellis radicata]
MSSTAASSSAQSSGASSSGSSTVSIPASAQVGSLSITQPSTTSTSYFKNRQQQPSHIRLELSPCSSRPRASPNTYPMGDNNGLVAGDATQVVWDVYSYQTAHSDKPLPQGTCSLMICDERGYDATEAAGYLAVNSDLTFALYTLQPSLAGIAANPTVVTMVATFLVVFLSGYQLLRSAVRAI